MAKDRTGEFVVDLFKDGAFFAQRSLTCGKKLFEDAVRQWQRKGYTVVVVRQPKEQ